MFKQLNIIWFELHIEKSLWTTFESKIGLTCTFLNSVFKLIWFVSLSREQYLSVLVLFMEVHVIQGKLVIKNIQVYAPTNSGMKRKLN